MPAMRTFVLVAATSGALAAPCLVGAATTGVDSEVRVVVERHNKALNAHDLEGVMATYSPAPGTVLLGTGPGEAYLGGEAISAAYDQFFTRFKPDGISFKNDWLSTAAKGDVAWFAMTMTMTATADQSQHRDFNVSGVLQKSKGQWRFVSLHFSRLGAEQQVSDKAPH